MIAKTPEILTHHAPHCSPPWLAVHVPSAQRLLAEYPKADFSDLGRLMADYCNVLDRAGLLHYGETEAEAVRNATENNPGQTP